MSCEQELCGNWTGQGCACEVFGLEPDVTLSCEADGHRIKSDGRCACGMVYNALFDAADDDDESAADLSSVRVLPGVQRSEQ